MNQSNNVTLFFKIFFLVNIIYFSPNAFANCDGIEPTCSLEELDSVYPDAIYYTNGIVIGSASFGGYSNDSPAGLVDQTCDFVSNYWNNQTNTYIGSCGLVGTAVEYTLCLKHNDYCFSRAPILSTKEERCMGSYSIKSGAECHMPREDKMCTAKNLDIENPICLATQSKKEKFTLYAGKGVNPLSFQLYYDSDEYIKPLQDMGWGAKSYQQLVIPSIVYLKAVPGYFAQMLRVDLPSGAQYHFTYYNGQWNPSSSQAGSIVGSSYVTKSGREYRFPSLPTVHAQRVYATTKIAPNHLYTTTYVEDLANKTITINNGLGRSILLKFNTDRLITQLTDPAGEITNIIYDEDKRLKEINYPDGSTKKYLYEDPDFPKNLTGKIDENNQRISLYEYNDSGKAISTERFDGIKATIIPTNDEVKISRMDGTRSLYSETVKLEKFNGKTQITQSRIKACETCEENLTTFEYNSEGYLTATTNEEGVRNEYTRSGSVNTLNYITQKKLRVGTPNETTELITYNNNTKNKTKISNEQMTTDYSYNEKDLLISESIQDNGTGQTRTYTYTYNDNNLVTSVTLAGTSSVNTTSFTYDAYGNRLTQTNSLNQTTRYLEYDEHGNPIKVEEPNGLITVFTYNKRQWLTSITRGTQVTTFVYDNVGNVIQSTSPSHVTLNYQYDLEKRVVQISNSQGDTLDYEYNGAGQITKQSISDSAGEIKQMQTSIYNSLNELAEQQGANGQYSILETDHIDNVVHSTNALNHTSSKLYDTFKRLEKNTDANSGETQFGYNQQDQLTEVTDPEGKITRYEYNAFGDITKLISPDTGETTFTYDNAGNLLSKTDARGITVTYTYDALNRVLTQSYTDSAEDILYIYDDTSNGNKGIGRLTGVTDPSGSTYYFYNSYGQVTKETRVIDGNTYMTEYHFDANGQMTGITYPSGRELTYSYDTEGRMSALTTTKNNTTTSLASNISYQPFGGITGLTYGNGKTLTQTYDLDYRLTDKAVTGIHGLNYQYDLTNNVTSISDDQNTNNTQSYVYDAMSRLIQGIDSSETLNYNYDRVGNRLTKNNPQVQTYTYETVSHRLASLLGLNPENFIHDAMGNMTVRGNTSLTYNQQGRLSIASKMGMNANYRYNYKGERVQKLVNGVKTNFIYDLNGLLIAESDALGNILKEYVDVQGQPFAQIINEAIYYYHNDHLGTPKALTDVNQNIVWQATHTPFGKATITTETIENNIRFPGQYFDSESGLHYNYFRDYDPGIGRYIQSDPIGLAGGINTYAYVSGNPINYFDPYGLEKWDWDGIGDTSVCSYYSNLASSSGCGYYNDAAEICRGENSLVNAALTVAIFDAWARGNSTASESEIYNQVRNGLISADSIFRALSGSGNSTPRGDMIDLYHNDVFRDAGLSSSLYGGNLWPQGVWPNVVPYDPIGNSRLDPRRSLLDAGDRCECSQ